MPYSVVVTVIEIVRKRKIVRSLSFLFLVLSGLVLLAAYLFGEQVYGHEQEDFALLRDARVMADLDGFSCQTIPTDRADEIRKAIWRTERFSEREPSWRLEVVDYYLTWLRRRLLLERAPVEESRVYVAPYPPPAFSETKRLKELVADTSTLWRTQVPNESEKEISETIQRLADLGYVLPKMITDDQQMTGSLLRSNPSDGTFRYFASPTDVFAPVRLTSRRSYT